jgi:replicative DNA helicase
MSGEAERTVLYNLQKVFMELKKYNKNTVIQLTQLNREIEDKERINNNTLHFPMRKDVFGSDALFQASDVLMVIHRPEILHINSYGVHGWPVKNMLYLHILKNREGELGILSFHNHLEHGRIEECTINNS